MRAVLLFILGLLTGACCQSAAKAPESPPIEWLADDLAAKTVALVVQKPEGAKAYCSGVWVSPTTILTAYHCIEAQDFAGVSLIDYVVKQDVYGAGNAEAAEHLVFRVSEAYAMDPGHDLALLRASGPVPGHRVAKVAQNVVSGAYSATMGHPLGLWWSFSAGNVAAIRKMDLEPDIVWVQTTAPTSKGNSGCGLFDSNGDLMGIAHAGMPSGSNLAFYVHTQYAADLMRRQGNKL